MQRLKVSIAILSVAVATSCNDSPLPTAPADRPSMVISDASNGGTAGFYFLPPMVPKPSYAGVFDPDVSPVVQVCETTACSTLHTAFSRTTGSGSEVIRMDPAGEFYIVNWNSDKTGALAGRVYRIRVMIDGSVAGFADVQFAEKGKNAKNVSTSDPIVLVNGNTLPIKFRIETGRSGGGGGETPTQPETCRSCLEVVPGAFILTVAGQQKQLDAFLVNAQGLRTKVAATFESSDPDKIPVNTTGLATATVVGSTKIVAHFNGQTSREVLVLFATPVADALLITDDQIDGPTTPVDPLADFKPGFRYHVHLKGVTPVVGQVIVNTGFAAVAGRVISVTPGAGFVDVVLELLPANAMFSAFKIHQQFSLKGAPFVLSSDLQTSFDVHASPDGGLRLTQIPGTRAVPTNVRRVVSAAPGRANNVEFNLLSFSCEAEVKGGLDFPLTLDVVQIDINPALTLTIDADNGFKSAIVTGSITPRIELKPSLTAAVEGKVECKKEISAIYPMVLGVVSLIVNAWVPYGIGFALEAKTEVAGIGFDALLTGNITTTLGVACVISCGFVHGITKNFSNSSFKASNLPTAESIRTELAVKAFVWANLRVGNMFLEDFQYDALEIQAGLNQKFELAGMKAQALDSTYGSGFDLSVFAEAGNGTELTKAAGYLSISLPELKLEVDTTLAESPKGLFKIEPDNVDPGDENALGETAKFTVSLNPATYLGAYAVDEVEIRWLKEDEDGNPILEPGRPGCTDIHPISFQSTFECTTDFRTEDIGVQTFYAFVHARLFGLSFPIPLEIGDNARAKVKVEKSGTVHRRTDQSNGTFFDMTISTTQPLTPSGSGYSGTGTVTYEQTVRSTNAAGCTFHDHWNGTGTTFTITPHPTLAGRWNVSASVSGTLQHASITDVCGFFSFPLPFSSTPIIGPGKEIRRDGVLVGFDFNLAASTSTVTTTVTGKLKIN